MGKTTKTNREYCKEYREKTKDDYRKNDRERKKFKRDCLKYLEPEKYEIKKKQERERLKLYRARKKEEAAAEKARKEKEAAAAKNTPEGLVSFRTVQSFSRSVKKAEDALPFSPTKRKEVITGLAQRYQLRIKLQESRGRKAFSLTDEQIEWLENTLERPDLTYITPGRKDNVYVGKNNEGVREYVQKRYLLWSLRDLLEILNGTKLDCGSNESFFKKFGSNLSFSLLYNYIKSQKHLIYNKDIPHGSCLCEVCENSCLLAKGINRLLKTSLETNPHDTVENNSCNSDSFDCMNGECVECCEATIEGDFARVDDDGEPNTVSFSNWCRRRKVTKAPMSLEVEEMIERWNESVKELKKHIHRKRVQVAEYNRQKNDLVEGEILIQCDYSENYKNKDQDEIQSAYFGHQTFSIFTACYWAIHVKYRLYLSI